VWNTFFGKGAKMNDGPLVSIVIDNFNYAQFLDDAVRSALNQTYSSTEIIVVDDGSTDESRDIIAAYGDQIIPVLKNNGGQGSVFNAGFRLAHGEIVVFLDADDYLLPHALERVVSAWRPDVVKVQYRLSVIDASGRQLRIEPPLDRPLPNGDVLPVLLKRGHYPTPPTSGNAFAAALLRRTLPMPEEQCRISGDWYLYLTAPFYGAIRSIEDVLGIYRVHATNSWSTAASAERFRIGVKHEHVKHALVAAKAKEFGLGPPPDPNMNWIHLRDRLGSLRLDPLRHPVSSDDRLQLVWRGLRALWGDPDATWKERLLSSLWFLWAGLLPLPLARGVIAWLIGPQTRPKAIERILHSNKLRIANVEDETSSTRLDSAG
jgi:glycosyltransferase involved in cell wall biosynthesis